MRGGLARHHEAFLPEKGLFRWLAGPPEKGSFDIARRDRVSSYPWVYPSFEGARLESLPADSAREYQTATFRHPLMLESGESLPEFTVAYESYGTLSSDAGNAVLICHALTGDSHVARHQSSGSRQGWWEGMVGPGLAFDTRKRFVICSNVLGGCRGTTGPRSIDPITGSPYASNFPSLTVRDMVAVEKRLLEHLGISRLACVAGGSMGGMQALEWALTYPDAVESCVAIGIPNRVRAQALAFSYVQRAIIENDDRWLEGDYRGRGPVDGLSVARMLAMITYQSEQAMELKFGKASGTMRQISDYLRYQGRKLVRRFDAGSYVCLLGALDSFDIGRGRGGYASALEKVAARMLVLGISSDILYPVAQQRELSQDLADMGKDVVYREIRSTCGHDGFLLETQKIGAEIGRFLDTTEVHSN
jgi:homoserine O-acetyltransferase/O-succinyltransferase